MKDSKINQKLVDAEKQVSKSVESEKAEKRPTAKVTRETRINIEQELCTPFKVLNALKKVAKTDTGLTQLFSDLSLNPAKLTLQDFGRFCQADETGVFHVMREVTAKYRETHESECTESGGRYYIVADFRVSAYLSALKALRADKRKAERESRRADRMKAANEQSEEMQRALFVQAYIMEHDTLSVGEAETKANEIWAKVINAQSVPTHTN